METRKKFQFWFCFGDLVMGRKVLRQFSWQLAFFFSFWLMGVKNGDNSKRKGDPRTDAMKLLFRMGS